MLYRLPALLQQAGGKLLNSSRQLPAPPPQAAPLHKLPARSVWRLRLRVRLLRLQRVRPFPLHLFAAQALPLDLTQPTPSQAARLAA